ncbi:hypothetical protein NPIL_290211, partial [Nephila pilipes]
DEGFDDKVVIIELPLDRGDEDSNLEDVDDNALEDKIANDVASSLEMRSVRINEIIVPHDKENIIKKNPFITYSK